MLKASYHHTINQLIVHICFSTGSITFINISPLKRQCDKLGYPSSKHRSVGRSHSRASSQSSPNRPIHRPLQSFHVYTLTSTRIVRTLSPGFDAEVSSKRKFSLRLWDIRGPARQEYPPSRILLLAAARSQCASSLINATTRRRKRSTKSKPCPAYVDLPIMEYK